MNWYSMVWKKYAEFGGRSRRTEYWMFTLINVIVVLVLAAIGAAGLVMSQGNYGSSGAFLLIPVVLYALAAIIPSLAVATRRFHDTGKSGWLLFLLIALGIIPLVGFVTAVIQIVFLCTDSDQGPNQYGPNPKFPAQAVGAIPANPGFATMGYPAPPQPVVNAGGRGFCGTCGAPIDGPATFCGKCGAQV